MAPVPAAPAAAPFRRLRSLALALATIALGLAVHLRGGVLPPALRDVAGDALWAAMVLWWIGVITPGSRLWVRGAIALAISFAVEFSQLYHAPTLDAIRQTTIGRLVLGSGFDSRDFAAYTIGVLAAVLLELALDRQRPSFR